MIGSSTFGLVAVRVLQDICLNLLRFLRSMLYAFEIPSDLWWL